MTDLNCIYLVEDYNVYEGIMNVHEGRVNFIMKYFIFWARETYEANIYLLDDKN